MLSNDEILKALNIQKIILLGHNKCYTNIGCQLINVKMVLILYISVFMHFLIVCMVIFQRDVFVHMFVDMAVKQRRRSFLSCFVTI